jgi:rod shape-determining protein MreD
MKAAWLALALATALLAQTSLSLLAPGYARLIDPFLLVLVYRGLAYGETEGLLAGAAAGWIQDVHFGGRILGITALVKGVLGYVVGLLGSRFVISGVGSRLLVLCVASLLDVLIYEWLAAAFDVATERLALNLTLWRALLNAFLGTISFALIERRLRRDPR